MDYVELVGRLRAIGLKRSNPPPDVWRASLYLDHLEDVHHQITEGLRRPVAQQGLGEDCYNFVQRAVEKGSLLKALAKTLDQYVAAAVFADLYYVFTDDAYDGHVHGGENGWNYLDYFNTVILGNDYEARIGRAHV